MIWIIMLAFVCLLAAFLFGAACGYGKGYTNAFIDYAFSGKEITNNENKEDLY